MTTTRAKRRRPEHNQEPVSYPRKPGASRWRRIVTAVRWLQDKHGRWYRPRLLEKLPPNFVTTCDVNKFVFGVEEDEPNVVHGSIAFAASLREAPQPPVQPVFKGASVLVFRIADQFIYIEGYNLTWELAPKKKKLTP